MKRMAVQYNRLWKLLIDKKMKKSALTELADVSSSTIAKLNRDEYVSLEVLERICRALRCDIGDVVELTEEKAGVCQRHSADRYFYFCLFRGGISVCQYDFSVGDGRENCHCPELCAGRQRRRLFLVSGHGTLGREAL